MNLYLDSSVIVKRYVTEAESAMSALFTSQAAFAATSSLSLVEVAAAIARAVRLGRLSRSEGWVAQGDFRAQWPAFQKIHPLERIVQEAAQLAVEMGLRGYDAVHLASALAWSSSASGPVTLATYDRKLWLAAKQVGLEPWPAHLSR